VAAIWLVFLVYPVMEVLEEDSPARQVVGLAVIAAYAVTYLLGWSLWHEHALKIWAVMLALLIALTPIIGVGALALTPYLGVFSAVMLPPPWWKWATVFSALLPLVSLVAGDFPTFFFLMVWPIIGFSTAMRVFAELGEQAVETRSELALVAERERVARDVHDVLGHSLTALSIKAELASRLIEDDPARAKAELESIQATARQALAEIRATVGGLRASNLEAELVAAPQVLADAGVETQLVGSLADTDPRHRALLAWILRESVTNVVRHAGARSVVIELGQRGMSVTDDGAGLHDREGNGLRGMRERVSGAGGTLTLHDAGPGTRVQVDLP
jgi:two-component system sensor histidine kinase DesK